MSSARAVRVRAYAKINLTLEVLGRREDGYHALRTVMQTVSLADTLTVGYAPRDAFNQSTDATPEAASPPIDGNLALRARDALRRATPSAELARSHWAISLSKRILTAAGLGGGSSDGAAVLRALNHLCGDPLRTAKLEEIAATFGSDAPFFVRGGTQLAEGRGELLRPLPDIPPTWFVLVPRAATGERKTARLFSLLRPEDFGDGSGTDALLAALTSRRSLSPALLRNSFERREPAAFPDLAPVRRAVERVCGHALLCGAGPSLFAVANDAATANDCVAALAPEVRALAVRSVPAAQATAFEEVAPPSA